MNFSPDTNYQQPEPTNDERESDKPKKTRIRRSKTELLADKIKRRDKLTEEIQTLRDDIKKAEAVAAEKEFKEAMEKVKGMGLTAAQIIEAAAALKAKSRTPSE